MNTKGKYSWGTSCWCFLNCIVFNAPIEIPIEERQKYKSFFTILGDVLPCSYCRCSYKQFLEIIPIDNYLDTRLHLAFWLYQIHCKVNEKLKKPNPSFVEFCRTMNRYKAGNN